MRLLASPSRAISALILLLFTLPVVLSQGRLVHVRIVEGNEKVVDDGIASRHRPVESHLASANLTKRWDGSPAYTEWQPAVNRGCNLNAMMHLDDIRAGQYFAPPIPSAHSQYLDAKDLKSWGYVSKALRKDPKCDMGNGKNMYGLEAYMNAQGISTDKKDWNCVRVTHGDVDRSIDDQTYPDPRNPSRQLRVTGARYHLAMNPKDGVIIIAKQYSPDSQNQYRRHPVPVEDYPELRLSSDIIWLTWKKYHDQGAKLNRIITWTVTNGKARRVLATALDPTYTIPDSQRALQPYPWAGWTGESTEGAALLGSPNGGSIGYLLVQHKPELGNRRVKRIEAFAADTQASGMREPSLAWELEDLPANA